MPRIRRTTPAAVLALSLALCLVLGVLLVLWSSPPAGAAGIGQLQQQIGAGQSTISSLSGQVSAATGRLNQLDASISTLQKHLDALQADLDAKRAELIRLQSELATAHVRLAQLEARQAHGQYVLAQQLVNTYEIGQPDLVTVILESHGFQDLLERLSFAQRIRKQDVQIIHDVKSERRAVAAEAVRLGALEVRQQALTTQVLNERDAMAATQETLLRQRISVATYQASKAGRLASVRSQVADLQHQLAQALAAQAAAAAQRAAQTSVSAATTAPAVSYPAPAVGASGFVFPLPKGSASPPGSWSEDQGVDISAPGDTPEYAVCSGTIVLHGIGGFGPWAPVLHCDAPIDGYSYVYYGHAGPANQLPVGTHVGAGAVMSSVGPGIVGISTGPHLEIGFADSSGSPAGGASTMMSLLQGSY